MSLYYFDGYAVDVVKSSTHTAERDVTEFETEDGENFTDHVRRKPIEVTFTVIVSNSPLAEVLAVRSGFNGAGQDEGSFVDEARTIFEGFYDSAEPITIEAPLRTYERMALTSLGVPQEAADGESIRFDVAFRQIRTVKITRDVITIPRARGPRRSRSLAFLPGLGALGLAVATTLAPGGDALVQARANAEGFAHTEHVLAHNPTTGADAYYYPAQRQFRDADQNVIDGTGYSPMKFDDGQHRWVDRTTGKPIQDLPPHSTLTRGSGSWW